MMKTNLTVGILAAAFLGACGGQQSYKLGGGDGKLDGDAGTGGNANTGGHSENTGGDTNTGGQPENTGGDTSTGGVPGTGGTSTGGASTGGASTGGTPGAGGCTAECCPTAAECYSDSTLGQNSPGAECLATHDNTGQDHHMFRQTWLRSTAPAGNTIPLVYQVLSGGAELPWAKCAQNNGLLGSGRNIQLLDLFMPGSTGADISTHSATLGFSTFVSESNLTTKLTDGLCMGSETYTGDPTRPEYALKPSEIPAAGADWPTGLPKPMAQLDEAGNTVGWNVAPTKAKRVATDFDLTAGTLRRDLLAKLAPTGEYGSQGFSGIFYYDATAGTMHSFSPLSWTVIYNADGITHIAVPVREVELRNKLNDPARPNCMGQYGLDPSISHPDCKPSNDADHSAWGGGDCSASTGSSTCAPGRAPAVTRGYFLISELEQIYSSDLQSTLCVSFPTLDVIQAQGFLDETRRSCRTAKWDPSDPVNGIPLGDWCAATNSPATASCHDAFRSESFHTFAAAKIKTTGANVASCAF